MKRLFSFLLLTAVTAGFSLLLLTISRDPLPPAKDEAITHAGFESGQDLASLAQRFGVSVPYFSLLGSGQVTDEEYPGGIARVLIWSDSSGCTFKAVRPAGAASLLRDDTFYPGDKRYLIGDMTAAVFTGGLRNALYFGNDMAAYALFYDASRTVESLGAIQFTD